MDDAACTHLDQINDVRPGSDGCAECIEIGDEWINLRMCMTCGQVGCCNSSKNKHAMKHYLSTEHPIIQSFEPGETWWFCWADELGFELEDAPNYSHPE